MRSASAATWVFSRATLVTRGPAVAWRKNVRRRAARPYRPRSGPGGRRGTPDGTRPVSIGSDAWIDCGMFWAIGGAAATASPYCGRRSRCARTAPDRGVLARGFLARRQGRRSHRCPRAGRERPETGVTDRGDGTRIDGDPLKEVEMKPERVRDKGLDDVAVRAHEVDGVGAVIGAPRARSTHVRPRPRASAWRAWTRRRGRRRRTGAAWTISISGSSISSASLRPGPVAVVGTPRSAPRCAARSSGPGVEQRLDRLLAALRAGW